MACKSMLRNRSSTLFEGTIATACFLSIFGGPCMVFDEAMRNLCCRISWQLTHTV